MSKIIVWRARRNLYIEVTTTRIAHKFYISFGSNYFSALGKCIAKLLKVVLGSGYGIKIEKKQDQGCQHMTFFVKFSKFFKLLQKLIYETPQHIPCKRKTKIMQNDIIELKIHWNLKKLGFFFFIFCNFFPFLKFSKIILFAMFSRDRDNNRLHEALPAQTGWRFVAGP